ncbi:hypothetical protein Bca4012_063081 [Brassica carinata]
MGAVWLQRFGIGMRKELGQTPPPTRLHPSERLPPRHATVLKQQRSRRNPQNGPTLPNQNPEPPHVRTPSLANTRLPRTETFTTMNDKRNRSEDKPEQGPNNTTTT